MNEDRLKQVIVVRKDLKMRRGKEIAQGSHASVAFLSKAIRKGRKLTKVEQDWCDGAFRKICVIVNSEEELIAVHERAKEAGLNSDLIQDSGRTEFGGVPTYTCVGIGPDYDSSFIGVTDQLKLY